MSEGKKVGDSEQATLTGAGVGLFFIAAIRAACCSRSCFLPRFFSWAAARATAMASILRLAGGTSAAAGTELLARARGISSTHAKFVSPATFETEVHYLKGLAHATVPGGTLWVPGTVLWNWYWNWN
jgi:hypothetical protein